MSTVLPALILGTTNAIFLALLIDANNVYADTTYCREVVEVVLEAENLSLKDKKYIIEGLPEECMDVFTQQS